VPRLDREDVLKNKNNPFVFFDDVLDLLLEEMIWFVFDLQF